MVSEIERLAGKVGLLEKFIDQQTALRSKRYQKIMELLLFFTALGAMVQLLLPIPIQEIPHPVGWTLITCFALTGIIAIMRSR